MSATDMQLVILGPLPPPLNGMTVMTSHVLAALRHSGRKFIHLDTSDHRPVGNVGRLDPQNVVLALRHALDLIRLTGKTGEFALYLPIAQGELGFLRDALFFEIARWRRMPVIVHLHGASFGDFYRRTNAAMRWLIRRCLRRVDQALVLSESLRGVFEGLISPEKISVVPNGIPEPDVDGLALRTGERHTVLFLSNLSEGKGYLDLIEAAGIVLAKRDDVEFVIAGEWPTAQDRVHSHDRAQRLGISDRTHFVSSPSGLRKHQLFRSADIFVFPPRQTEGQPVVLLEAMSYSLPVITTPVGGIVDMVQHGVNGVLVRPGHHQDLADAILQLMEDKPLRLRMGADGKRAYDVGHTIPRLAKALEAAFMTVPDLPAAPGTT